MSTSRSATRPVSLKSRRTVIAISRTRRFDRQLTRSMVTLSSHPRRRNPMTPFRKQPSFSNTRLGVATEEQPVEDTDQEMLTVGRKFNVRSDFSDAMNRGRLDIARNCLSQMKDFSILDYNQLMQLCVSKRQLELCQECFIDLQQRGLTPNKFTYSILLNLCVQRKDLKEGLKIVEQIKEHAMEFDIVLYNLLIKLYMVNNKVSEAVGVLNQMKESGVKQNIITYNYILGGHCRPSNGLDAKAVFERVQDLFKEMKEKEISPDARTYAALSRAALRVERIDLVESYIKEMLKSGHSMKESDYVVLIYSFASRIQRKQQDKKIELSWNLLRDMRKRGLNLSTNSLDAFTSVYASFNRLDLVFGVWNYYQMAQVVPNSITYSYLLKEVSANEENSVVDRNFANSFIELMDKSEIQPDRQMIEYLMQLMVKHRHIEGALKYLREMHDRRLRPKATHYNLCLRCFIEDRSLTSKPKTTDICLNLLKEMRQNSIQPNNYSYFTVIRCAMYSSNWIAFHQVLDLMKEANFQPSAKTFGGILNGCSKMEDSELGKKLAWEYFQQNKDSYQTPTVTSYTIMMNFCIQSKDFQTGIDLFDEMQASGIEISIQAYTTLLCLYGYSGDLDKALEVFEKMKAKGLAEDRVAFHCIIRACGMNDRFDKAVELFSELKTLTKPDARAYGSMMHAAGSCRRSDWVMQYYEEMIMSCDDVLVPVYNGALRALIECAAYEDARRVIKDMESKGYRPGEHWRKTLEEVV